MNEKQIKLAVGSMLHDIGKIVYRTGDGRNHSQSGYEYLKNEAHIEDAEILDCVRCHHSAHLRNAGLPRNSLAYITCFADNVAAALDRRERENPEQGFDKQVPLASIFNILNGSRAAMHYEQKVLDIEKEINAPTEAAVRLDENFYQHVIRHITDNLRGITLSEDYLNSLLTILEANTTYIPSSTSRRELADISLYDHLKMTAALAACVEQALAEQQTENYQSVLYEQAEKAYDAKWFLLYSMDISGIQKFIYSVGTDGALKGLRARSFYLELLMEHMIDELLEKLNLSRANLIYTGGGHCYLLIPNTAQAKAAAGKWHSEVNFWLTERFGTALYVAAGGVECSAKQLHNDPSGCYPELFREMSRKVSAEKAHRYSAAEIIRLNHRDERGERECRICRRMEPLNEEGKCELCAVLEAASSDVLYENYFVIERVRKTGALPLPGGCSMTAVPPDELTKRMTGDTYVRSYTKNKMFSGRHVTTKLLVGDYTAEMTFEQLADSAAGIKRIAVLRADVDNLGSTFVSGFPEAYASLSRTASLSRQLSLFFKGYINYILKNGKSAFLSSAGPRSAAIVYSGGDDLFLVGAWNEVIDAFIDIRNELRRYTENTLTISGGIGIYPGKYPVNLMASETEYLEDTSKKIEGKNAVTVFDGGGAYPWTEFIENVLQEKYRVLKTFFSSQSERGMAFLYHLLELLRNSGESIQFARYIYLLSRMEPEGSAGIEAQNLYRMFSEKMVEWYRAEKDRKELITAIYLFVYQARGNEPR